MCDNKTKEMQMLEDRLNELKDHVNTKIKPVEEKIVEHPIPSVLIAAGIGICIGALLTKMCKE